MAAPELQKLTYLYLYIKPQKENNVFLRAYLMTPNLQNKCNFLFSATFDFVLKLGKAFGINGQKSNTNLSAYCKTHVFVPIATESLITMVDNLTGTFALPGLATTTDTVQAVQKKEDQRIKTIIQIKEQQQMKFKK